MLSLEEMRALAARMRLNLTDCELEAFARDLCELEQLATALLPYAEPIAQDCTACSLSQMRADAVVPSLAREVALANAAKHNGECLTVPCVIGEGEA